MVMLKGINEKNFYECLNLEVSEDQKSFVAGNVSSLALAWLHYKVAEPYAIYNGKDMVGFLMLDMNFRGEGDKMICKIWRLMIDKNHQRKGYGRAALKIAIDYIKHNADYERIFLSYVPENLAAKELYKSFGFKATGEIYYDEIVMELVI